MELIQAATVLHRLCVRRTDPQAGAGAFTNATLPLHRLIPPFGSVELCKTQPTKRAFQEDALPMLKPNRGFLRFNDREQSHRAWEVRTASVLALTTP
jgi:hypothetical protein